MRLAFLFAVAAASALGLAAFGGGFLVGRWGHPRVGVREASLAGLCASLVPVGTSWVAYGFAPESLLAVVIAVSAAALGGWLGRRRALK